MGGLVAEVEGVVAAMSDDDRLLLRGALAGAKIALNIFTNTEATSDSERNMVFRIDPNDFLRARHIENYIDTVLAETLEGEK